MNKSMVFLSINLLISVFREGCNTDHAGLEILVDLCIALPFSRQIAIGNAGPTSALESMGAKQTFGCHFVNIGPSYEQ